MGHSPVRPKAFRPRTKPWKLRVVCQYHSPRTTSGGRGGPIEPLAGRGKTQMRGTEYFHAGLSGFTSAMSSLSGRPMATGRKSALRLSGSLLRPPYFLPAGLRVTKIPAFKSTSISRPRSLNKTGAELYGLDRWRLVFVCSDGGACHRPNRIFSASNRGIVTSSTVPRKEGTCLADVMKGGCDGSIITKEILPSEWQPEKIGNMKRVRIIYGYALVGLALGGLDLHGGKRQTYTVKPSSNHGR